MKYTSIVCLNCGKVSDKPLKEITRQQKKGNYNFFCDKTCYHNYQIKNHSQEWDAVHHRARYKFIKSHSGPLTCYFCHKGIRTKFDVHHKDNNHKNDDISNLVEAHTKCHNAHHKENYKSRKLRETGSENAKRLSGLDQFTH